MSQVAEDLVAAITVLDDRGWCQRSILDSNGRVCLVGALRVATVGSATGPARWPQSHRFHEARMAVSDWLGAPSTVWNDQKGRTEAEVRDALLGASRRV